MTRLRTLMIAAAATLAMSLGARADGPLDYKVLATSRTSTMEQELNWVTPTVHNTRAQQPAPAWEIAPVRGRPREFLLYR